MRYWNVDVVVMRAGEMADLELEEVGAWTRVSGYCIDQENDGRIKGARNWSDMRWRQTTGVAREAIERCKMLLSWDGDDLLVANYPLEQQDEHQTNVEAAREAGRASGRARRKLAEERRAREAERLFNGQAEVVQQPPPPAFNVIETGRGKEKEKEEEKETRNPIQGEPPTPGKPAGAAPLSVSVSNFSQIQNQTLNQTSAPSSPPLEKDAAWLAGFEEFWTNYPRKDARRKAEQAWRNVKGKDRPRLVELMQALGRQSSCPAWREQDGRFIPLPATWINGRRWEDGGTSAAAPVQQTAPLLAPLLAPLPLPLPVSSPFGVKDADGLSPLQRALAQSQPTDAPLPAWEQEGVAINGGGLPW